MAFEGIERYLIDVIQKKHVGILPAAIRVALHPLSWLYNAGVSLRRWAYKNGVLSSHRLPIPVVSVGNITAGGTGKTPLTLLLAQYLVARCTLGVIARGYRSRAEHSTTCTVLSKGRGPLALVEDCGDEPFLFSRRVPQALYVVGPNRVINGREAMALGAKLLLMDDGMQHLRLYRDMDIVVVDAHSPMGQGFYLPRGFLRDTPHALSKATLIVINHAHTIEQFKATAEQLRPYSATPIVGMNVVPSATKMLDGTQAPSLKGKSVGIFCGIGRPEGFLHTVATLGAKGVATQFFKDHTTQGGKRLQHFALEAQSLGAECLICTEKDAVHLHADEPMPLPIVWVKAEAQISYGKNHWKNFLKKLDLLIQS